MAEEIITSWGTVEDLFIELVKPGETKVKTVARDMLDGLPRLHTSMQLRVVEASGREVQFPLKLISATKVTVKPEQP